MEIQILERYKGQFVKLVYFIDADRHQTAAIKGELTVINDSFLVKGDYNEISGLIVDVKSCKRWFK